MENLEQNNEVDNKPKQYIFFKKIDALEKANFYEYLSVMID
jgi:hypothetical protein